MEESEKKEPPKEAEGGEDVFCDFYGPMPGQSEDLDIFDTLANKVFANPRPGEEDVVDMETCYVTRQCQFLPGKGILHAETNF